MLRQSSELRRERFVILEKNANQILIENKLLINFCSNDYLGLSSHLAIKKSFIEGIQQYGVGSGSSALVSGFYRPHQQLEEKFAEFLQCEKTLLVGSGYHANIGIIRTLVKRQGTIIADKLCHASLLDGIQLSNSHCVRYSHNNLNHLNEIISTSKRKDLLITESVFSMEGEITPLDQIASIAKINNISLLVDDAHGIGVLGENGRGILEHYHLLQNDITCLVVPLGKAFAGMGAIVAGREELIDSILQFSKSYCYSTALPPAIAQAGVTALAIIQQESWRREQLKDRIRFFVKEATIRNLPLVSEDLTPIKSILTRDNKLTVKIKNELFDKGFFISCIRPPTVREGTARIRISLNCLHTEKEIRHLLDLISDAYEKHRE